MADQSEQAGVGCSDLKINTKESESKGKQQHHDAGLAHIQRHDPPGPLVAEGTLTEVNAEHPENA